MFTYELNIKIKFKNVPNSSGSSSSPVRKGKQLCIVYKQRMRNTCDLAKNSLLYRPVNLFIWRAADKEGWRSDA